MRVRIGDLEVAAQDAELVALRVGQRDPAAAVGTASIRHLGGAVAEQSLDLLFPGASVGRRSRWSRFLIRFPSGTSMKSSRVRPSAEKIMHS